MWLAVIETQPNDSSSYCISSPKYSRYCYAAQGLCLNLKIAKKKLLVTQKNKVTLCPHIQFQEKQLKKAQF